jgi:hypothetical protein
LLLVSGYVTPYLLTKEVHLISTIANPYPIMVNISKPLAMLADM